MAGYHANSFSRMLAPPVIGTDVDWMPPAAARPSEHRMAAKAADSDAVLSGTAADIGPRFRHPMPPTADKILLVCS